MLSFFETNITFTQQCLANYLCNLLSVALPVFLFCIFQCVSYLNQKTFFNFMMFCPKCGSLMFSKNCSCGYVLKEESTFEVKEELKTKIDKIDVVGNEEDSLLPETDAECPKCKHNKAVFWLVQTRAGDEPETKFLKCKKCGHTWRDYK